MNVYSNNHNKIVRNNGQVYRIIVARLGKSELVDAECTYGSDRGQVLNLKKSRSVVAGEIRSALGMGLVS